MFRILFLMLLVLAGLILGPYISGNQGYVRIETEHSVYEMSIVMLVVLFAVLMVVVYVVEWVVTRLLRLSRNSYQWFGNRKHKKAQKQTLEGLMQMTAGNYSKAEKLISKNAKYSDEPVLNFIKAAESAQQQGDELSANKYLIEAVKIAGPNSIVVELARTRLLLQQGKLPAARSAVDSLLELAPNNIDGLRLAIEIYQKSKAYKALDNILDEIGQRSFLLAEEFEALKQQATDGLLDEIMNEEGQEGLLKWWESQPSSRRRSVYVRIALIKRLLASDDQQSAEEIALETVKKFDDEQLQGLFIELTHLQVTENSKLLKILAKRSNKAKENYVDDYARALGYLYAREGLFEKAKPYFEQLLAHQECNANDRTMALYVAENLHDAELVAKIREENLKEVQVEVKETPIYSLPEAVTSEK
ncbi:heme biosynthesis protein HemY [Vespertiliibacter pulmonis]|uniref:HemY protein n=1 Tax=Vespertiliibacter pulmonis TaxID=1443036 RepID=A0A3N4VRF1_9PAST|nr:heme biosynthesis HemY N-terminal domain-containing protein [Vespertiliibacter pulmonis]QLB21276.1 heme biosynthesis protein HemY [Vespertiliibacter pulmonis]RPE85682.1 HemY protein [Vespertiliibacter pulmonis]